MKFVKKPKNQKGDNMLETNCFIPKKLALPHVITVVIYSKVFDQLTIKLDEYKNQRNQKHQIDNRHKKEILELLLKNGVINIWSSSVNVALTLGKKFNVKDFEHAWNIIHAYVNNPHLIVNNTVL